VEKREHDAEKSPQWDSLKVVERKVYSLDELKRRKDFE
jgi:hypothetical protein